MPLLDQLRARSLLVVTGKGGGRNAQKLTHPTLKLKFPPPFALS